MFFKEDWIPFKYLQSVGFAKHFTFHRELLMKNRIQSAVCMLAFVCVATASIFATTLNPPDMFSKSAFEASQAQAKTEAKLFLVDATATWCGPCKKMDKTTWVDDKVVAWVKQHAIAAQIDVDAQKETAVTLKIEAMPTIIVFKDGKEYDRIVGYKSADELLEWLNGVLQGKHAIDKVIADAGDRNNPEAKINVEARMELAQSLASNKKFDLATDEFLWLWEHMLEHNQGYSGVRVSFMASDMTKLAEQYEPAKVAFTKLRDAARQKMDAGSKNRDVILDWFVLCEIVDDEDGILAWFDKAKDEKKSAAVISTMNYKLFDLLVEHQRWADAGLLEKDPVAAAQTSVDMDKLTSKMNQGDDQFDAETKAMLKKQGNQRLFNNFAQRYACCLAAEKNDEATDIAKIFLEYQNNTEARVALVKWAMKVNQPREEQLKWLDEAAENGASVKSLRSKVQDALAIQAQEAAKKKAPATP
jgi:thioredoxin 1